MKKATHDTQSPKDAEVPLSSFYYQKSTIQDDAELRHQIRVIASESNHTYCKRRIKKELEEQGLSVSS